MVQYRVPYLPPADKISCYCLNSRSLKSPQPSLILSLHLLSLHSGPSIMPKIDSQRALKHAKACPLLIGCSRILYLAITWYIPVLGIPNRG